MESINRTCEKYIEYILGIKQHSNFREVKLPNIYKKEIIITLEKFDTEFNKEEVNDIFNSFIKYINNINKNKSYKIVKMEIE